MRVIIVGNGPAAISCAETFRQHDQRSELILLSREVEAFYSPCPLAEYVDGSLPRERLFLRDPEFYERLGLQLLGGQALQRVEPRERRVLTTSGQALHYDKLLLAYGARAITPPIPGLADTQGVYPLKTLADADAILRKLPTARRAVVIGSGFIGLEAAQALHHHGLHVSVLEAQPSVLPSMLDAELGQRVEQRLRDHGIDIRTQSRVEQVQSGNGNVSAVIANRAELPCDLLICAAGVAADVSLLAGSGIACGRGVLVDDYMQTNVPEIYAAGDLIEQQNAEDPYRVVPIWPNAVTTGRIAALNMLGHRAAHPGLAAVNVVRIFGQPVASFGHMEGDNHIRWEDHSGAVRQIALDQGRICGGQLLGEINGTGMLLDLMHRQVDVSHLVEQIAHPSFSYVQATLRPQPGVRPWP